MKLPVVVGEKISVYDLIFKYTIRDFLLGIVKWIPASPGILARMLAYKIVLKKSGKGLRVAEFVTIKFPENIIVGNNVSFNEYDWIDGNGLIEIGDYVSVGPRVSLISFDHEYSDPEKPVKLQGKILAKIVIQNNVWLGAGAIVRAGVTIGEGSVIGAGSIVLKDVPPHTVVAGVPAKVIKMIEIKKTAGNGEIDA